MNKAVFLLLYLFTAYGAEAQKKSNAVLRGNQYYRSGAYDLAVAEYRFALQQDPNDHVAQYNLANVLYRQNKFSEAIAQYRKASAVEEATRLSGVWYNEGVVHSNLKNPEVAVESYKKALRLNPDDQQARENLQKALSELKKNKQNENKQDKSNTSKMSQKEAEEQLKMLQEKEKRLQQKLQGRGNKGNKQSKDW